MNCKTRMRIRYSNLSLNSANSMVNKNDELQNLRMVRLFKVVSEFCSYCVTTFDFKVLICYNFYNICIRITQRSSFQQGLNL